MMRKVLSAVLGLVLAAGILLPGSASAGLGAGVVTATPEKNSVGDDVAIDATGNCASRLQSTLIVTVKGPDGNELDSREFPNSSDADFTFTGTDQVGVYTVTADCDVEEGGDLPRVEATGTTETVATPAFIAFSYEPDTFEVFEPGVSATRLFTNDPASPTTGVIAGRPTFTG